MFEQLEERRMLSAVLDITTGVLTYTAGSGSASNATISVDSGDSSIAEITDNDQTISLTANAMTEGWTGSGTNTVSGPVVSYSTSANITGSTSSGQNLTVDFSNGDPLPASGISFTPTAGTGNQLFLINGTFLSESYLPSGAGAGTITYSDASQTNVPITFSNLSATIADTSSSPTFVFNDVGANTAVNLVSGPSVNGVQTDEINDGGAGDFTAIDFGNKVTVTANANNAGATTTLDITTAATGLTSLFVNSGAGNDTVDAQAIPSAVTATVDTGSATGSTINVGLNHVVSGIQGTLIAQSTGGSTPLSIDDGDNTSNGTVTFGSISLHNSVTGLSTGTIEWSTGIANVTVDAGTSSGGNAGVTFDVDYGGSATLVINGGAKQNTYNIGNGDLGNISGTVDVNGHTGGTDVMTVNDSGNTFAESYIFDNGTLLRDGHEVVDYNNIATTTLNTTVGDGAFIAVVTNVGQLNINVNNDANGTDTVNIGAVSGGGDMANIQGPVSVTDAIGTYDLSFLDEGDATGQTWTLNNDDNANTASLAVTGASTVSYRPGDLNSVSFYGGSGGNDFEVNNVTGNAPTTIYSGAGNDGVYVYAIEDNASLTVNGQDGYDEIYLGNDGSMDGFGSNSTVDIPNYSAYTGLTLDDSADTTAETVDLTNQGANGQITGLGGATVTYSNDVLDGLTLNGGSGGNTFNIDGTLSNPFVYPTTTEIDKGSGSGNTVNISGISTTSILDLTGTGTDDTVNLEAGATLAGQLQINEAANSTALVIDLSSDNLPHDLTLSGDGTTTTLTDSLGNMQTFSIPTAMLTALTIDTSALQPESLTVDFSDGNPINGTLTFNGGADSSSPSDSHSMTLQGGSFVSETETLSAPSTGSFALTDEGGNTSTIDYSGLQPITDTVPASIYTLNDTGTDQSFSLTDGAGGSMVFANTPSNPSTPTFESNTFSNKTVVTINVPNQNGVGFDAVINAPTAATGLTILTVNVSANGTDQINVQAIPSAVVTTINGGPADDQISVLGAGVPDGAALALTGGAGNNTLTYDADGADPLVGTGGSAGEIIFGITDFGTVDATGYQNIDINDIASVTITPGSAQTIAATEGTPLSNTLVGSFTLPLPSIGTAPQGLPVSDFTATIHWGDTTTSAGTIVQDASNPGVYDIFGSHNYTTAGNYLIANTVNFNGGTFSSSMNGVSINVTVPAAGPTNGTDANLTVAVAPISVNALPMNGMEGISFAPQTIATFTQSGTILPAGDFTAVVTIFNSVGTSIFSGIGTIVPETTPNEFIVNNPTFTLDDPGTYREVVTVTNTLYDVSATSASTITVADAPLLASGTISPITASTGATINTTVGQFQDVDSDSTTSDFTATIDWGDGSAESAGTLATTTGIGNNFVVNGRHAYTKAGVYTITTIVTDVDGSKIILTDTATITDQPVTGSVKSFSAAVGKSTGDIVLATFTDPNPLATISDLYAFLPVNGWGDGTPTTATPLAIEQLGATSSDSYFEILGSHTYASTGSFSVNISVTTYGGVTTVLTAGTASVYASALSPTTTPNINATAKLSTGQVTVGTFLDTSSNAAAGDYTAVIDWGDGSPTTIGTISFTAGTDGNPATVQILGSHTYAAYGTYTIHATASSSDGNSVTTTATATAAAPHLVFSVNPASTTAGNKLATFTLTADDASNNVAATDHSKVKLLVYTATSGKAKLVKQITAHLKAGTATFSNVDINIAGNYTIEAVDGRYASAVSNVFTVSPTAAKRVKFVAPTSGNVHGHAFSTQVEVLDKYGNIVTNDSSTVTIALGKHSSGASLSGTLTAATTGGVADFTNLVPSSAGNYILVASDSKLTPKARSAKFVIG
ncbi:MAG TPA: hypothetical protein VGG19_10880 [Tepidisphaeraceae bacterium]